MALGFCTAVARRASRPPATALVRSWIGTEEGERRNGAWVLRGGRAPFCCSEKPSWPLIKDGRLELFQAKPDPSGRGYVEALAALNFVQRLMTGPCSSFGRVGFPFWAQFVLRILLSFRSVF
jgi:hypothetical protein